MLRFAVGAVAMLLLLAGCAPELNWRDWRSDESGMTQLFPCKPVRQQRNLTLAGHDLLMVLQVCDAGGVTWALSHAMAPDPASVEPLLDALSVAAHANLGVTRGQRRDQAVPGATPHAGAGRYVLKGRTPQGHVLEAQVLVFARGLTLVQMTALGERLPADAVDTFFTSVRAGT